MSVFEIPQFAEDIIDKLEAAGYEAWLVGGCVRDCLLGREPHDWDIASSAAPDVVIALFEKTVPTGVKYGTVTVFCNGRKAEVTTFRSESGYDDCRRPSNVSFGKDIITDLSRRDFTINAMAYNTKRGLLDPLGGRDDMEKRLVSAVGNPDVRFMEDALRILRAFRFAAQLDFTVEPLTLEAAFKNAPLVEKISGERIKSELDRMLLSERAIKVFELARTGALNFLDIAVPPEITWHGMLPYSLAARYAAFFYLCEPIDVSVTMDKLRFDTRTRNSVLWMLSELEREPPDTKAGIKRRLSSGVTPQIYADYLRLNHALKGRDTSEILAALFEIEEKNEPYTLRMLAVNGTELTGAGFQKGPECGRILTLLLDKVIENPNLNDRNMLLSLAKQVTKRQEAFH
jgi:tRNA nucleotidyltransferase (CCA-adding enzyme)